MKETTKAHPRRVENWAFVNRYFVGIGLDVGAGDDGLKVDDWPNADMIDWQTQPDGGTIILPYKDDQFDFIYSSNTLEHMNDTIGVLIHWLDKIKQGGYIIFTVPDFTLYEQGLWPSRWNQGHLHQFSVGRVIELVDELNRMVNNTVQIRKIELIDTRYDYSNTETDQTFPEEGAEAWVEVVLQKTDSISDLTIKDLTKQNK